MIDQLRTGWRLWRGRHENPLYIYLDPRRRRWEGLVYRLGWLPLIVGLALLVVRMILPELHPDQVVGWPEPGYFIAAMTFIAGATLLFFRAIAHHPWPTSRCVDLALSRMTPGEVAFGFAYWPVLGMTSFAAGFVLIASVILSMCNPEDDWYVGLSAVVVSAVMIAGCSFDHLHLRGWKRWRSLVVVPVTVALHSLPMMLVLLVCTERFPKPVWFEVLVLWTILLTPWCAFKLWSSMSGLGQRLLATVAPAESSKANWEVGEAPIGGHAKGRSAAHGRFVHLWLKGLPSDLVILAVGGAVLDRIHVGIAQRAKVEYFSHTEITMASALCGISFLAAAMISARRIIHGSRLPIISGDLVVTTAIYSLPPYFAAVLPMLLRFSTADWDALPDNMLVVSYLVIIPFYTVSALSIALLLVRRRFAFTAIAISMLSVSVLAFLALLELSEHEFPRQAILVMSFAGCLFSYIYPAFIRLFREETLDVPLGRLTTDDNTGLPFMSDEVLDRLTSEGDAR